MTIRLKLDADALDKLQRLGNEYIVSDVLPQVVESAKRIVPVDTGDLQDSIHAESEGDSHYVVASSEYAVHVEQGTSKMPAQPFLRPALYKTIRG